MRSQPIVLITILFAYSSVVPPSVGLTQEVSSAEAELHEIGKEYDRLWTNSKNTQHTRPMSNT
ncbi:MAG: hypothetical protein AAFU85_11760 [Planctomycetota bacterium]